MVSAVHTTKLEHTSMMNSNELNATTNALRILINIQEGKQELQEKAGKADEKGTPAGILAAAFLSMLHAKDASPSNVDTECNRIIEETRKALKRDKLVSGDLPAAFRQYRSNIKRAIQMTADDLEERVKLVKISHVNQFINGNAHGPMATIAAIKAVITKVRERTSTKGITVDSEKKALKVQRDTLMTSLDAVLKKALKTCKAQVESKAQKAADKATGKRTQKTPLATPELTMNEDGTVTQRDAA